MLKKRKVYVLRNEELRMEIIWLHHDILTDNRIWRKIEDNKVSNKELLVARSTKDVGKYVEEYDACQRMKNRTEALTEKLMANEVLEKLWMHLTVDFITKLLLVAGKNTILVVCNMLSKTGAFYSNHRRNIGKRISKVV